MALDGRIMTAGIAIALIVMGIATLRRQARAVSCPRHCHTAGRIAIVVGWTAMMGGVSLLAYTLLALES